MLPVRYARDTLLPIDVLAPTKEMLPLQCIGFSRQCDVRYVLDRRLFQTRRLF